MIACDEPWAHERHLLTFLPDQQATRQCRDNIDTCWPPHMDKALWRVLATVKGYKRDVPLIRVLTAVESRVLLANLSIVVDGSVLDKL